MNRIFLVMALLPCLTVMAENPMDFREYTQEIVAEFATPDEARRATAEISKMPNGEELAFTSRWDDSNTNNVNMSATLKKSNVKGTFFLTSASDDYFAKYGKKLVADGNSIGAHSMNHPILSALRSAEISYQIMLIRPLLESKLDIPVNSFVLPYCNYANGIDSRIPGQIRDAIFRSGIYCCPEPWINVDKTHECKGPRHIISTCYFIANDSTPTEELFFKNLNRAIADAKKKGNPPVITLGTHAWQKPAGFEVLNRCFEKIRKNNWWFCTVSEFASYRYEYLYCPVRKGEVDGTKVNFTVRRIAPDELGVNMPLSLLFTVRPTKVTMQGQVMPVDANNICKLPHNAAYKVPEVIDFVHNPQNAVPAKGVGTSKEIPGVEFGVHYEKSSGSILCRLGNLADADLKNIRVTLRLPLRWEEGIFTAKLNKLSDEFARTWRFDPGKENGDADSKTGRSVILAQCDFEMEGKAYRLYCDTVVEGTKPLINLGRNIVSAGPFAKDKAQPDMLIRFSDPAVKLQPFGTAENEKWLHHSPGADFHDHAANIGTGKRENYKFYWPYCGKGKGVRVSAVDFELSRTENLILEYNFKVAQVYLNGILLKDPHRKMRITASPGKNRLLVVENNCSNPKQTIGLRLFSERLNSPVYNFSRPEF